MSFPGDLIEAAEGFLREAGTGGNFSGVCQTALTEFLESRGVIRDPLRRKMALVDEAEAAGVDVEKILTEAMRKAVA